jgi:hypothetical protein
MEKLPESVKELRPHFTFKGIELLWEFGRAAIVAAVVASWQWLCHHWDIVTIGIAFCVPFVLLVWRDWSVARRGRRLDAPSGEAKPALDHHSEVPSKDAPLGIVSAQWGPTEEEYVDRTTALRETVALGMLDIAVDWRGKLLGDPYPGRGKHLTVEYLYRGQVTVDEAIEIQHLILPEHRDVPILKQALSDLRRSVGDLQKESIENRSRNELIGKIGILKAVAREIKRSNPSADFNKRPLFRASWNPTPNSPTPIWFNKAAQWHDEVCGLDRSKKLSSPYLCSLGFDGVMELLDDAERDYLGLPIQKEQIVSGSPDIQITRWGIQEPESEQGSGRLGRYCLFVANHGGPACRVEIRPSLFGPYVIESCAPAIETLLKEHGEGFFWMQARGPHPSRGMLSLSDATLSKLARENIQGNSNGFSLPVPLSVQFQDSLGGWHITRHEMTFRDNGSPFVQYINHEVLTMLPT